MRQPFAVLIPRRRLSPNGVCRRGTGRSWRQADRRMKRGLPAELSDRSTRSPNARPRGDARSAPPSQGRRVTCVHLSSRPSSPPASASPARRRALALPASGNAIDSRSRGQPADRAGLLAALLHWHRWHRWHRWSSSLVIITSDNGPGVGARPRSRYPTATASRLPRLNAAMKFARASASARPRGSSTWRARKNPVSAKPSSTSCGVGSSVTPSPQKRRQHQQPVLPRLARLARHRPP